MPITIKSIICPKCHNHKFHHTPCDLCNGKGDVSQDQIDEYAEKMKTTYQPATSKRDRQRIALLAATMLAIGSGRGR